MGVKKAKAKGKQGQGESKSSKRRIEAAERRRRALELRKAGTTFQDIAERLGYAGPSGAYKAVSVALAAIPAEAVGELRRLESQRLDQMQSALWLRALAGNPKAIEQVLKIMHRRATMLGLDHAQALDVDLTSGGKPIAFVCDPEFDDWQPPAFTDSEQADINELATELEDIEAMAV